MFNKFNYNLVKSKRLADIHRFVEKSIKYIDYDYVNIDMWNYCDNYVVPTTIKYVYAKKI